MSWFKRKKEPIDVEGVWLNGLSSDPSDIIVCRNPLHTINPYDADYPNSLARNEHREKWEEDLYEQVTKMMIGRGGLYSSVTNSALCGKINEVKAWKSRQPHPTNCKNCGAVLQSNKCEYCKTNYGGVTW
jgi:hypothetical protein